MILYHGTHASLGQKIISDGCISAHAQRYYDTNIESLPETATEGGFNYLTDTISMAVYYGNCHAVFNGEREFYIFRADIDESLLLPDLDELKMTRVEKSDVFPYTYKECLKDCHSVRTAYDICSFDFIKLPSAIGQNRKSAAIILKTAQAYTSHHDLDAGGRTRQEITEALMQISPDWAHAGKGL